MIASTQKQKQNATSQIVSIYIRNSKKQAFIAQTNNCIRYQQLANLIYSKTKIHPDDQIVYYNGKQLQLKAKITLVNKSIVHVIDKRNVKKSKINILVKKMHGNGLEHRFQIDADTSIQKFIKDRLSSNDLQPAEDLFFVYTGRQLKKDKSFSEQFVEEGSQIICMRQNKSLIKNVKIPQQKVNSQQESNKKTLLNNGNKQELHKASSKLQHSNLKQFIQKKQVKAKKIIKSIDQIQCKQYESDQEQKTETRQIVFQKPKEHHHFVVNTNSNIKTPVFNQSSELSAISASNFKKKNKPNVTQIDICNSINNFQSSNNKIGNDLKLLNQESFFELNNKCVQSIVEEPSHISNGQTAVNQKNISKQQIYDSQITNQQLKQIYGGKGYMNLSNDNFLQSTLKNIQGNSETSSIIKQQKPLKNIEEAFYQQNSLTKSEPQKSQVVEEHSYVDFNNNFAPQLIKANQLHIKKSENESHQGHYKLNAGHQILNSVYQSNIVKPNNLESSDSLQFSHNVSTNNQVGQNYDNGIENKNRIAKTQQNRFHQIQQSNLLEQNQANNENYNIESQIHAQFQSINFSLQQNPNQQQESNEVFHKKQIQQAARQEFNHQVTIQKQSHYLVEQQSKKLVVLMQKQGLAEEDQAQGQKDASLIQNLVSVDQNFNQKQSQSSYNIRVTQVQSVESNEDRYAKEFINQQFQKSIQLYKQPNTTKLNQKSEVHQSNVKIEGQKVLKQQQQQQVFLSYQLYQGNTQSIASSSKFSQLGQGEQPQSNIEINYQDSQNKNKQNFKIIIQQIQNEEKNLDQIDQESLQFSGKFVQPQNQILYKKKSNNRQFECQIDVDTQLKQQKKLQLENYQMREQHYHQGKSDNQKIFEDKPCLLPGDYVYLGESNVPEEQDVLKDIIKSYLHCL